MARKKYDSEGNKIIHYQKDFNNSKTGRGDTTQHGMYTAEKGSSNHEHIFSERNYSTGTTREGGHGKNYKK